MTEPVDALEGTPRASLRVSGRSIARHQVDAALALDCTMVVCLIDAPSPEPTLLRAEVESAGARLEIARDLPEVRGLCPAGSELLVITEGLVPDPATGAELLRGGPAVLVQPADVGLPLGFERLDLTRAAGGMMLVPARLLADLPEGYDVPSALTRVALQAGVPTREVPGGVRAQGRWQLVRNETEAQAMDDARLALDLGRGQDGTPSDALARLSIRAFGSALLHSGGRHILVLGSAALLLLALSAGWFGAAVLAFAIVAVASVASQGGLLLLQVDRGASPPARLDTLAAVRDGLIDVVLLLLMVRATPILPDQVLTGRAFAPLMLIGFVRLGSTLYAQRFARLLADRAIVSVALLIAAALHALPAGVEALALTLAFGASIHLSFGAARRQ